MRRVVVDRDAPQRDAIDEAAKWIRAGYVVAIPTDTLYGLAADPFSAAAVARVFDVKGRAADRALPLIAADVAQIASRLGRLSEIATRLADRFWPGPLTLLMPAARQLAREVSGETGTVGVRVPADAIARAVCAACGHPVTATSANLSGAPAAATADDVEDALGDRIEFLLDAGPTPGGAPSTIVDVTAGEPRLVRAGAIAWEEIQAWLHSARA
jgi:L-threonylcarbamoyladenylate synthase